MTRTCDDPERLMNSLNRHNEAAIIVAARNNNIEVLKLLHRNKANFYQVSLLENGDYESAVDVAVRWKCKESLTFLLENVKWSDGQLRHALDRTSTEEYRKMIRARFKSKPKFFCFG